MNVYDAGEPISRGRRDRRRVELAALRIVLFMVALFGGVWLVNGILAILFIALMQELGLWGTADSEFIDEIASDLAARVHDVRLNSSSSVAHEQAA